MKRIRKCAKFVGYELYHGRRINEWRCPNKGCEMHVSEEDGYCRYCGQMLKFEKSPSAPIIEISMKFFRDE